MSVYVFKRFHPLRKMKSIEQMQTSLKIFLFVISLLEKIEEKA